MEREFTMRSIYAGIFKNYFYNQLLSTRSARGLTQSQMARCLRMEDRSYIDLDHGKSCCSALTLALFLIYLCEDPMLFLNKLRKAFEAEELKDIQDKMIATFGKKNADEFISAIRGADIPIEEHCYRSGMLDGLRLSGLIERLKSE